MLEVSRKQRESLLNNSPIIEEHGLVQRCHSGSGEGGGEDGGDNEREHLVLAWISCYWGIGSWGW